MMAASDATSWTSWTAFFGGRKQSEAMGRVNEEKLKDHGRKLKESFEHDHALRWSHSDTYLSQWENSEERRIELSINRPLTGESDEEWCGDESLANDFRVNLVSPWLVSSASSSVSIPPGELNVYRRETLFRFLIAKADLLNHRIENPEVSTNSVKASRMDSMVCCPFDSLRSSERETAQHASLPEIASTWSAISRLWNIVELRKFIVIAELFSQMLGPLASPSDGVLSPSTVFSPLFTLLRQVFSLRRLWLSPNLPCLTGKYFSHNILYKRNTTEKL